MSARPIARPETLLLAAAALFVLLWTLAPLLAFQAPPLDVGENLLWGQEWQWGYYKHPPLQAWLSWTAFSAVGLGGVYFLSALCIAATAGCIYLLGKAFLAAEQAVLAALLFLATYYATIPIPEFNANVLQMPIWAFAGLALWRALENGRLLWWLAFGLACAAAIYTKYSAVFLFAGLAGAALSHPSGLASLRRPGPYAAILLALLLCAPHFQWLVQSGFQPIYYAAERAKPSEGIWRVLAPFAFFAAQLAAVLPALLLALIGGMWRRPQLPPVFLLWLALGPLAFMALYSVIAGEAMRDMWGAPASVWLTLLLVTAFGSPRHWRRLLIAWAILLMALPLGLGLYRGLGPSFGMKPGRIAWPAAEIADRLDAAWKARIGGTPRIIAGSTGIAGMVVSQRPGRAAFVDGEFAENPWITRERLAREGAIFGWSRGKNRYSEFKPFDAEGAFEVPLGNSGQKGTVFWGIVAPASSVPAGK